MSKSKKKRSQTSKSPQQTPPDKSGPSRARMVAAEKIAAHRAKERRRRVITRSFILLVVLAVAGLIGYTAYRLQAGDDLPNPQDKPGNNYAVPAGSANETTDKAGVTLGKPEAATTVEVYLDYRCPHCKEFEDEIDDYLEKQAAAGAIKVIYHPIGRLSGYSVLASAATGCAIDEGKFTEYNRELFERQKREGLDEKALTKLGRDIGIDSAEFGRCVDKRRYLDWVLGMNVAAEDREVIGTPTVYVNNEELVPRGDMATFVQQIKDTIAGTTPK